MLAFISVVGTDFVLKHTKKQGNGNFKMGFILSHGIDIDMHCRIGPLVN